MEWADLGPARASVFSFFFLMKFIYILFINNTNNINITYKTKSQYITLNYITLHFHFSKTTIQYKHTYGKKKRNKEANRQNKQKITFISTERRQKNTLSVHVK